MNLNAKNLTFVYPLISSFCRWSPDSRWSGSSRVKV